MIVNAIDWQTSDSGSERGVVVPVQVRLCATCQKRYKAVYRFGMSVIVLVVLILVGVVIAVAVLR